MEKGGEVKKGDIVTWENKKYNLGKEYKEIKKLLFQELGANEDVLQKRKEYLQKSGARHINEIT
jgi:hypothetical protein